MEQFHSFIPSELSPKERYQLLTQCLVPRPIALVATVNTNKTINLAPYSFFAGVSAHPPSLCISASAKADGTLKDSTTNIFRNKEFSVHVVGEHLVDQVAQCGEAIPYGESELEKVGLTTVPCTTISHSVRVLEADVAFECVLFDHLTIYDKHEPYKDSHPTTLLVGKIKAIHIRQEIMAENKVDYSKFKPLARLGGSLYSGIGPLFDKPTKGR